MSTDDIPEHLIEAYESSDDYSDEHPVERILAALRPEDAHRVPAWDRDRAERARAGQQRDEARAEVERLNRALVVWEGHVGFGSIDNYRARLKTASDALIAALNEVERLRAQYEPVESAAAVSLPGTEARGDWAGRCVCNRGPDTEGPDETCPQHGRSYSEWIERGDRLDEQLTEARTEIERLKAGIETKDKITLDLRLQEIVDLTAENQRLKQQLSDTSAAYLQERGDL